jgi:hypothetical protein
LSAWEKSGDPRVFKFIISPEFGDRVNHQRLTRDLMTSIERDLGKRVEWLAVTHHNTAHPHTHVALRGIAQDGSELRFTKHQLSQTIRLAAQKATTRQLGYRSEIDRIRAAQRDVSAMRFTDLDRTIAKLAAQPSASGWRQVAALPRTAVAPQLVARLQRLEGLELAQRAGGHWYVSRALEPRLRAMQNATDRQRALRQGMLAVSDSRLPVVTTKPGSLDKVEGRILGHGHEDVTGKHYMLLESPTGRVHYVHHNSDMQAMRAAGELRAGSYAQFRVNWERQQGRWRAVVSAKDWGDAERLLTNPAYLNRTNGPANPTTRYGGWLGRRQQAFSSARDRGQFPSTPQHGR